MHTQRTDHPAGAGIWARVEADSVGPTGVRVTTLVTRFPRIILEEFNTHRVFSRNTSSSRALPVGKRMRAVEAGPYVPTLTAAGRGMASNDRVDAGTQDQFRTEWLRLRNEALAFAAKWAETGHKQHVNRALDPFAYVEVVVTATEWDGFLAQRDHPDAQPEMQALARCVRSALIASTPRRCDYCEWHLPFVADEERAEWPIDRCLRVAVGRLCRVSYETHDGRRDPVEDEALCHRLLTADPPHCSPFEHVCIPRTEGAYPHAGNLRGWTQLRHLWLRAPWETVRPPYTGPTRA
jgi:thymidylate synthase ThyX